MPGCGCSSGRSCGEAVILDDQRCGEHLSKCPVVGEVVEADIPDDQRCGEHLSKRPVVEEVVVVKTKKKKTRRDAHFADGIEHSRVLWRTFRKRRPPCALQAREQRKELCQTEQDQSSTAQCPPAR